MKTDPDFGRRAERLERLLHDRLGLSRGDLATRVARARRGLPRAIKRDVLTVAEAARLAGHPRIAPQIDRKQVALAYKRAEAYLHGPEARGLRKGRFLGMLAGLVVNLSLAFALVLAVLALRDFI